MKGVRGFLRDNGLSLVFGALFLGAVGFQAIAGHNEFNDEQRQHEAEQISLWRYVTSARFASAVLENWQSEYLQFTLFILLTVWFLQRGSPESKEMGKSGGESDEDQKVGEHAQPDSPRWASAGGIRTFLYSNSLVLVMGLIWAGSWLAQAVSGWTDYNDGRLGHHLDSIGLGKYLTTSEFWERSLQNWQSEFLAVGSMAILAVYLRQRGSPESKPVGAPHDATGIEG
ncbi:MAG TPA: DUF6766 family protein [Thermoleophilaceae bacterium]|nr:DUF6766 family protein [Thermoleophilaceae bacterium]